MSGRQACAALCAAVGALGTSAALPADRDLAALCGECVVEKFAACGGFLEGATFARDGTLWVVDLLSGNLLSVDERGRCTVEANTGGAPNGAKFHRDGRLFIADKNRGLLAYDPEAQTLTVIADSYRAERLRGLNDLAFDANGGLYFTEPYGSSTLEPDGRVFYLPPGPDAALTVVADTLAFPNGVVVAPQGGNVYVGEYANKKILSLPAAGSADIFDVPYVVARTAGGVGPDGLALDADGNIYAAIFQGKEVAVIGADGFEHGSIELPEAAGTFVTNLAFHEGYLYITEASAGEVWRVRVAKDGLPLFHQQ